LLTSEVKNEGWVVLFMILVLFAGISLFYLAYLSTDETVAAHKIKTAYESGKNEILLEIEEKPFENSYKPFENSILSKLLKDIKK